MDENSFKITPIKIKLPPIGTFKQYVSLRLSFINSDKKLINADVNLKKILNTSTNEINLRLINPQAAGTKIVLIIQTEENTLKESVILLDDPKYNLLDILLSEDSFAEKQ